MKICNVCGKEFEENEVSMQQAEDGTEYYICNICNNEGVEISDTQEYYICRQCGYPHQKDEYNGICKFCENKKDFERLELTQVETELLDSNPQKFYKEKLGEEHAKKISDWIESPHRREIGIRHKRDRFIDTAWVIGIIIGYILLELTMTTHSGDKRVFIPLLIVTVLVIATAPIFKKIDRLPNEKPLPLWLVYVFMAILVDIFAIIVKFFA